MVYLKIDKELVSKESLKKANEESLKELDEKDNFLFKELDDKSDKDIHIDEDSICISTGFDGGYVSVDYTLKEEDWISLLSICVKKINKIKTVLEGLK